MTWSLRTLRADLSARLGGRELGDDRPADADQRLEALRIHRHAAQRLLVQHFADRVVERHERVWPDAKLKTRDAPSAHLLAEIEKRAFRDRNRYLGDPEFGGGIALIVGFLTPIAAGSSPRFPASKPSLGAIRAARRS